MLQQFVPTPDEAQKVRAFVLTKVKASNPPTTPSSTARQDCKTLATIGVGKAEQYVYVMSYVPDLTNRLQCMSSVLSISETYPSVVAQAEALVSACEEVNRFTS
ncbi:hypothetical protein EON65_45250 [archaeon]|nr:MAG: hypothetical protein EON65_45250 [archaeon]